MQPHPSSHIPLPHQHHHHHFGHHYCFHPLHQQRRHSSLLHFHHTLFLHCPCFHLHHHYHHRHHQLNYISSHLPFFPIHPGDLSSFTRENPCPGSSGLSVDSARTGVSAAGKVLVSENGIRQQLQQDQGEDFELEDAGEEDFDDVFVLTDEWREFFANSKAKRRMEKQQKNKNRK